MSLVFLTSTGLSDNIISDEFVRRIGPDRSRPVAIVTTASEGKAENKYAKLALIQFRNLGFKTIDFIDIEFDSPELFRNYPIIYVCGGNTFFLLHHIKKSGADAVLKELLKKTEIVYIGVSAGSIILGPTIKAAAVIAPDPNDIKLTEFSGLGITDFEIHPHYEPEQEPEIAAYEKTAGHKMLRLSNAQALVLSDTGQKLIG